MLDFDGTLADSVPVLRRAFFEFLDSIGVQGSEKEFWSFAGPPIRDVVENLRLKYRLRESHEHLYARYLTLLEANYDSVPPKVGVRDFLDSARRSECRIAVVTSAPKKLALDWLSRNEFVRFVDGLVGAEDVHLGKPDPEPYLIGLKILNADARVSFAVEDSDQGIAAALAAGLTVFAVGCNFSAKIGEVVYVESLVEAADLLRRVS